MRPQASATRVVLVDGAAGRIDLAIDAASSTVPLRGIALVAHPHPLFGGTRDNKVVMTLSRALGAQGFHVLRPNFRGVGDSEGAFDEGRGETDDLLGLLRACRQAVAPAWWPAGLAWPVQADRVLAGFSFGAFVQTRVHQAMLERNEAQGLALVLVGLAVSRFDAAPVPEDTLVVHGEQDDVVPLSAVFDWARPQHLPVVVMPGSGHFFHGALVLLKKIVTDFLRCRYNTGTEQDGLSQEDDGDD